MKKRFTCLFFLPFLFVFFGFSQTNNAPVLVTNSNNILCEGNSVTFTATPTIPPGYELADDEPSYDWNGPMGAGMSATYDNQFSLLSSVTGNYKVRVRLRNIATNVKEWSDYSNIIVINDIPAKPIFGQTYQISCGESITITPTNIITGTLIWKNASGTTIVYQGNQFTTPPLSNTTSYLVYTVNGDCQSDAVVVTVEVLPIMSPAALVLPSLNPTVLCSGSTVILSVNLPQNSPYTVNWLV